MGIAGPAPSGVPIWFKNYIILENSPKKARALIG